MITVSYCDTIEEFSSENYSVAQARACELSKLHGAATLYNWGALYERECYSNGVLISREPLHENDEDFDDDDDDFWNDDEFWDDDWEE